MRVLDLLRYFFVTLGIIFFAILLFAGLVWWNDGWGLRTLTGYVIAPQSASVETATTTMTLEQGAALQEAGIDPELFTNISTAQEECFISKLGADRVAEIVAGAMPTAAEVLTGAPCLQD